MKIISNFLDIKEIQMHLYKNYTDIQLTQIMEVILKITKTEVWTGKMKDSPYSVDGSTTLYSSIVV